MKTIRHKETLFYYDCPQVFVGLDRIGGHYLSVLTEGDDDGDTYLTVGIEPEDLRSFRSGKRDLRELVVKSAVSEWFTITTLGDFSQDLKLLAANGEIPESMLPDHGFVLTGSPIGAEFVQQEAKARNNVVFEAWIDPPEAASESKIHATRLASFLNCIQTLVKHAYGKALSILSPETRREVRETDAHTLDALAFAPGSFKVRFEAFRGPDLFGFVEMQRALEKLDEITANADAPLAALEVMKANRGHVVGAYIRLLDFLIKTDTAFAYRWSIPSGEKVAGRSISVKQALPLFETLTKASQLGIETLELHGYLRKANSKNNTWSIESVEDGKEYSGDCKEGETVSHLIIDGIYRFQCEESLEEHPATGRETSKLSLISSTES